jgi:hypothetical protein
MNYEKIVTLYDTSQHADAARRNLEAAGFLPGEISTITTKTLSEVGEKLHETGFWRRLFGRDVQAYEALVYGRSIENGGAILTVRVPESDVSKATAILNSHEAVDLHKRALQQGFISSMAPNVSATPPRAAMAVGQPIPSEEVYRLAEEQLDVGTRTIQAGTMRIRRFVTEKPVEAQVTLHEEHIQVVRRTSSDPSLTRDVDWTEKTIEVAETVEEPVITKSVHIAEEVVVRKEASDTVKTVRDKVRRQQVEVEKVPKGPPVVQKA